MEHSEQDSGRNCLFFLGCVLATTLMAGCVNSAGSIKPPTAENTPYTVLSAATTGAASPVALAASPASSASVSGATVEPKDTPKASPVAPQDKLTVYTDPNSRWQLKYPAELLQAQPFNEDITVFLSKDRSTFAAIDLYTESASRYGNTGENLRNRARDSLALIYGRAVNMTDVISRPPVPWETGISFTTDLGSKGEAVYKQPLIQPTFTVYGFLMGYKASTEQTTLPMLLAIRESFQELK